MASLKDIKRRLRSVRNTKKITYAMKLVSAAKLKKAQDAALNFHIYTEELDNLLVRLLVERGERSLAHPLMVEKPEVKNICLVIVGGRRGLCGSYNTNLHKKIEAILKEKKQLLPGAKISCFIMGKKPADYFRRSGRAFAKSFEELPDDVSRWPIDELGREITQGFCGEAYDEVWLLYSHFVTAMTHPAVCEKLLPLAISTAPAGHGRKNLAVLVPGMTLFEPSTAEVFSAILPKILTARILQACHDARASETASRMTAMDSATRNAAQLIRKLELAHNKMRQLRITSELLDIIGGAEAIK